MSHPARTVLVSITGRVQGVWFRDWTRRQAITLGLLGWVRNRLDDSVEALFCGPSDVVSQMIEKCRQGPPSSRVDGVEVVEQENSLSLGPEFEIRSTG